MFKGDIVDTILFKGILIYTHALLCMVTSRPELPPVSCWRKRKTDTLYFLILLVLLYGYFTKIQIFAVIIFTRNSQIFTLVVSLMWENKSLKCISAFFFSPNIWKLKWHQRVFLNIAESFGSLIYHHFLISFKRVSSAIYTHICHLYCSLGNYSPFVPSGYIWHGVAFLCKVSFGNTCFKERIFY